VAEQLLAFQEGLSSMKLIFKMHICYGARGSVVSRSGGWSPYWVHSARRPLNGLLYLPRVIVMMENSDGMEIGRGNRSTRRKPAPAPLSPPQIPLDQTRARTRAAAVGKQRLTD
jgi:hypothetical protein